MSTMAQRRDTVNLANAAGYVRRCLHFKARGFNGSSKSQGNAHLLILAIRDALAIAKVRKATVDVLFADGGNGSRVVVVSLGNLDQTDKARKVMHQLGFTSPHYQHWVLADDMIAEGFSLP